MRLFTLRHCLPGLAICALQSGCSIITPIPLWELTKAAGGLASTSIWSSPPQASNTLYKLNAQPSHVCIEFNPQTQVADLVPALQAELQSHGIGSKVYDSPPAARLCDIWLEYAAHFNWGVTPLTGELRPYVNSVQLALRSKNGELLSSSQFLLDPYTNKGKWTDTRTKVGPVVTALVTGF
ncbi:hypothetical protein [Comamonas composti]|uniref:hypothetical protein n=1 Tax=Comamonas composti TaxID=408558 RepID=UPI00042258A0|nr:hypothetical protein [Comamonas composti]